VASVASSEPPRLITKDKDKPPPQHDETGKDIMDLTVTPNRSKDIPANKPIGTFVTLHLRLGGSSSWFPARPPPSLSGDSLLSAPPPCGATALPFARRFPSELHGGAQCAAPHHQAGAAAHRGEDSGASPHHQGLPSCAHHQGLPSVRSFPSAPPPRLPRLPPALNDD